MNRSYVVLAGNQIYYVVRADDRSICVATYANRYEAYAEANRRNAGAELHLSGDQT